MLGLHQLVTEIERRHNRDTLKTNNIARIANRTHALVELTSSAQQVVVFVDTARHLVFLTKYGDNSSFVGTHGISHCLASHNLLSLP